MIDWMRFDSFKGSFLRSLSVMETWFEGIPQVLSSWICKIFTFGFGKRLGVSSKLLGCFLTRLGYVPGHESNLHHALLLHYLTTSVRRTSSLFPKKFMSDRSATKEMRFR